MKAVAKVTEISTKLEEVLLQGDLAKLTSAEKVSYYNRVCESIGLNPLTKPFDYIKLNGREVLYAKRDAADQLRKVHRVAITVTSRELLGDVYVVTAQATTPEGRTDESTGAVAVAGLKGEALANAYMKAETKAKRRVTLSICGLGMLDETEVADTPAAREVRTSEVQARIDAKTVAPEFESADYFEASVETASSVAGDYVLKAGQGKGKRLRDVSPSALDRFVAWYDGQVAAGKKPHPDVKADFEAIHEFLMLGDPA